ncbi:MAG TPA: hypothetical protein VGR66_07985 [Candidatus Eisenbacteria bacterium]|jgi:hypothetical protein|nr:hypothetical protein [Candidatus Eisenbacteria bacterium]
MPLRIRVFEAHRLVIATGHGKVTDDDMFRYQHEFWTRREVAGFDEIVDMTQAEDFDVPTPERLQELADVSAGSDPPTMSPRLAIVAPDHLAFTLGRMYGAYREMHPLNTKQVEVFRTLAEALRFMGVDELA